jgi:hypothetical protein
VGKSNVEKSHGFSEHLAKVLWPHPSENEQEEHLKRAKVQEVINILNPNKSSGYDLITGKILKELPIIRIKYLTQLFTVVLLKRVLPSTMESCTDHPHLEARETP